MYEFKVDAAGQAVGITIDTERWDVPGRATVEGPEPGKTTVLDWVSGPASGVYGGGLETDSLRPRDLHFALTALGRGLGLLAVDGPADREVANDRLPEGARR